MSTQLGQRIFTTKLYSMIETLWRVSTGEIEWASRHKTCAILPSEGVSAHAWMGTRLCSPLLSCICHPAESDLCLLCAHTMFDHCDSFWNHQPAQAQPLLVDIGASQSELRKGTGAIPNLVLRIHSWYC